MSSLYSTPVIRTSSDISKRVYIEFYHGSKRLRVYNGNCIGIKLFPNRAKVVAHRNSVLTRLRNELQKRLDNGSYDPINQPAIKTVKPGIKRPSTSLKTKEDTYLTATYKVSLRVLHTNFLESLSDEDRACSVEDLPFERIHDFIRKHRVQLSSVISLRLDA